jgi:hypothetical protein
MSEPQTVVNVEDFLAIVKKAYESNDGINFIPTPAKPHFLHEFMQINYVVPKAKKPSAHSVDRISIEYRLSKDEKFRHFEFAINNIYMHGLGDCPNTDKASVDEYAKYHESVYGSQFKPISENVGPKNSYTGRVVVKQYVKAGDVVQSSAFVELSKFLAEAISSDIRIRFKTGDNFFEHIASTRKDISSWAQVEEEFKKKYDVNMKPMYLYVSQYHQAFKVCPKLKDICIDNVYLAEPPKILEGSTYKADYGPKTPQAAKAKGPFVPEACIKVPFWGAEVEDSTTKGPSFVPYGLRMCKILTIKDGKPVNVTVGGNPINAKNAWKVLNSKFKILSGTIVLKEIIFSQMGASFPWSALDMYIIPSNLYTQKTREARHDPIVDAYMKDQLAQSSASTAPAATMEDPDLCESFDISEF